MITSFKNHCRSLPTGFSPQFVNNIATVAEVFSLLNGSFGLPSMDQESIVKAINFIDIDGVE